MIIKYNYVVTIIGTLLIREVCYSARLGYIVHNKTKHLTVNITLFSLSFFFFFNQNTVDA